MAGLMDRFVGRVGRLFGQRPGVSVPVVEAEVVEPDPLADLPLRRQEAEVRQTTATAIAKKQEALLVPPLGAGMIDNDDYLYRRLTGNGKSQRRDLTPLAQDQMLEITNYLWEQNCFAKRLVTLMTDLILGEGVTVEADDERTQELVDKTWNHRVNKLPARIRSFYNALSVTGEWVIPVGKNPINGLPQFGYIDPYQIKRVDTLPDNVLIEDTLTLKSPTGLGDGPTLKIIRENPETGRLEGDVFFFAINKLPNSVRGRSDLLALADWLDLYDQYMFAEVERLNLLSAFLWDYKIEGATSDDDIQAKVRKLPRFKPGTVFGHNEKEELTARTPDLKAEDRSEVARMLRVHIAGSMGYPVSYLGDVDSNKATIEGQNDVMLKTPAARQKEVGGFLGLMVRFAIEGGMGANPALFKDASDGFAIRMPEISAKDISRIGQSISQVMTGMDAGLANRTMSKKAAAQVQCAVIKHLGVELNPQDVLDEAAEEAEEQTAIDDQRNADIRAGRIVDPLNPNPPIPEDNPDADAGAGAAAA